MFLNDYEKIRHIGKGAFASVYKVRHAELGYIRALKVCNNFIEDKNDQAWKTFLEECKVLLNIGNGSHPNVVRIYQPRLLDNRAVVEMDYVEGDTLQEFIRNSGFVPIEEVYKFAYQIIGAVAYCHCDIYKFLMNPKDDNLTIDPNDGRKFLVPPEKEVELVQKYGVVHNDLHSGNIIRRDYDGLFVLLDFGLAIQNSHCVKSSSRFDGAIEYCSPEKLERGNISPQSDVYALGILLFEMLTGLPPFPMKIDEHNSPESARTKVYQQQLKDTPPSIYELRKAAYEKAHPGETYQRDYPKQLEGIVMKCLNKNPSDRYANAKELKEAFAPIFTIALSKDDRIEELTETIEKLKQENSYLNQQVSSMRNNTHVSGPVISGGNAPADAYQVQISKQSKQIIEMDKQISKLKTENELQRREVNRLKTQLKTFDEMSDKGDTTVISGGGSLHEWPGQASDDRHHNASGFSGGMSADGNGAANSKGLFSRWIVIALVGIIILLLAFIGFSSFSRNGSEPGSTFDTAAVQSPSEPGSATPFNPEM